MVLASEQNDLVKDRIAICLTGIQQQNDEALSQFYDLTINYVYGLALRITGQPEEAEEVASDVYLQLWEKSDNYHEDKGSIMAWLLTICRSRAIDRLRKSKRAGVEKFDRAISEQVDSAASPEYILSNTQQDTSINLALQKLTSVQRQLLSLAFFRGMSYQEIADFIGMPIGTVKSHIRRSLIELKSEPSLQYCFSSSEEKLNG